LRSLNNALTLDPEEESTQVGMLALQSWYSGADGPGGHWMHAQFSKFDAGIVAAQAALDYVPDALSVDKLDVRLRLVEDAKSDQKHSEDTGGATYDAAAAKQTRDDIESFRTTLTETSHTIGSLQSELRTKAGQLDTSSALEALRRELIKLAANMVGRNQLSASLSSKLDRQDLGRIAALIANGELEGINPAAELLRREFL